MGPTDLCVGRQRALKCMYTCISCPDTGQKKRTLVSTAQPKAEIMRIVNATSKKNRMQFLWKKVMHCCLAFLSTEEELEHSKGVDNSSTSTKSLTKANACKQLAIAYADRSLQL
jgi:hypothetical protein